MERRKGGLFGVGNPGAGGGEGASFKLVDLLLQLVDFAAKFGVVLVG
jgi:hypothetical protein